MEKSRRIQILAAPVAMEAELNATKTAGKIWEALPLESSVNIWGDEIYFPVAVTAEPENPREVVEEGDLAYWPAGNCFCIFFGPTPASSGDEIRPASPVNVIGRVSGDPLEFKKVPAGSVIRLERK